MAKLFREFTPEKLEEVRTHPYYKNARETIIARADNYTVTDPPVIKFSKIHLYVKSHDFHLHITIQELSASLSRYVHRPE